MYFITTSYKWKAKWWAKLAGWPLMSNSRQTTCWWDGWFIGWFLVYLWAFFYICLSVCLVFLSVRLSTIFSHIQLDIKEIYNIFSYFKWVWIPGDCFFIIYLFLYCFSSSQCNNKITLQRLVTHWVVIAFIFLYIHLCVLINVICLKNQQNKKTKRNIFVLYDLFHFIYLFLLIWSMKGSYLWNKLTGTRDYFNQRQMR